MLKRHREHLTQILGLNYGIFRPDAVAANDPAPIYGGMWRDKSADPLTGTIEKWKTMQREILEYLESLEVFFVPTGLSNEMRKHFEVCLARQLRKKHPSEARFYPADNHTGRKKLLGVTIEVS